MNVNTRTLYYDWQCDGNDGGCYYNPLTGRPTFGLDIPRLDWVRIRVALTTGRAKIDPTTRLPLPRYRVPIPEYSSSLFVLKTKANYYGNGPLAFNNGGGFDATDTAWNGAADGCFTLAPVVIPLTVLSTEYFREIVLLRTAGSRWTLRPSTSNGLQPPACNVLNDVYSGAESNAPSGLPCSITGTWTIANTVPYVDVPVAGATARTLLAIGQSAPTGGAGDSGQIYQQPLPLDDGGNPIPNVVRLSVGQAPGQGGSYNGTYTLLILS